MLFKGACGTGKQQGPEQAPGEFTDATRPEIAPREKRGLGGACGTGIGEKMNLIVAVDANWAIGNKGDLLIRIPNDHKFFREETTGKVVVLGRKTLETFPQGMPLKNRTNIILSSNPDYKVKDAIVVHSTEELMEELKKYNSEDIYIIGGDSVYRQMLPYCDVAHVTKIDHVYAADAYFPNLDETEEWKVAADSDEQTYFDIAYQFVKYVRAKPEMA